MIYFELLDIIDDLQEEQRDLVLNAILKNLTKTSHITILESQFDWNSSLPYNEFIKKQNEIIKECIKIEMTPFGNILRREEGLRPLTLGTKVFLD